MAHVLHGLIQLVQGGQNKLERQYCKIRFGFVSTALAGARTVALCTHVRASSLFGHTDVEECTF